jgi:YVTN family beta-propeller protein
LLGVIQLGDFTPANLSPLYYGQLLVHGMGFSFDHKTLDLVSIGSNSVTFIDTATNEIKHTTYVGRSPHEGKRLTNPGARSTVSGGPASWSEVGDLVQHAAIQAREHVREIFLHRRG